MKLISSRDDGYFLYKAGEQYFESRVELTEEQQATDGEEILMTSGNLKQLGFNRESVKGWFNNTATDEDFANAVHAMEPIIIQGWQEKKVVSWVMEIY